MINLSCHFSICPIKYANALRPGFRISDARRVITRREPKVLQEHQVGVPSDIYAME
jgi:hypothetical protein